MNRWAVPSFAASVALLAIAARPSSPRTQTSALLDQFDFREKAAQQAKLPRALQEVSGLATTSDGRVFAHGDERAIVVQVDACAAKPVKAFSLGRPAVHGDFEGIAIAGERFFMVTSSGWLYEFRDAADGAVVPFTVRETGFGRVCEIEGLAYEPASRVLLMGCKTPLRREMRPSVTVLRWSLERNAVADPASLTIPLAQVAQRLGTRGFHTASIERDAGTGHYLLLAGPEHSLVELTNGGALVAAHQLHGRLHPQPEGLALLGDSVMVVADEGGAKHATMTCYRRRDR